MGSQANGKMEEYAPKERTRKNSEKDLNKTEINNMLDKEFKLTIVRYSLS